MSAIQQKQQPIIQVKGESAESVNVQSQLATSTVEGNIKSHSNISQVVQDLSSLHSSSSTWVDDEMKKISMVGNAEIQRSLEQAKALETTLTAGAMEKQRLIEEEHKVKLAKMVQELDLAKAAQLKELQDGLQRQIQSALTTSKSDIGRIETDMNKKKMDLMTQAQLRTAREVDQLSNLVVETQLQPSVTRTVIETNTSGAPVIAVATGAQISTGAAASQTLQTQRIEAVPVAGKLEQATDVRTGDMVQKGSGQVVGQGAIVNTMTSVQERTVQTNNQQGAVPLAGAGPRFHNDGDASAYQKPATGHVDASYGKPLAQGADYNKHGDNSAHQTSLLGKVKNALTGHSGEPKSSDATKH